MGPGPETHSRKGSIPALLKKAQKVPAAVLYPHIPATQTQPHISESTVRGRAKSVSPPRSVHNGKLQPARLQPPDVAPPAVPKVRSSSAQPPKARLVSKEAPRVTSNPADPRPPSASGDKNKRKSWLPGARSRAGSKDKIQEKGAGGAWILTPDGHSDYNTMGLENGDKVPELWNDNGTVYVYLYPKEAGRGPSFKVSDHIFASSQVLNELLLSEKVFGQGPRVGTFLAVGDAARRPSMPPDDDAGHLYLPFTEPSSDLLLTARNMFAFLTLQPLVGTKRHPTVFATLLQVADMLRNFGFTSMNGSSFGEQVEAAFDQVMEQFALADVRHSREKTIEALILSEQMRSWKLYNEAFAHAVGKYDDLVGLKSPLLGQISPGTLNRLERAHLDLENRQASLNNRLESFDFPSLFAGVASSTSIEEYKPVKFKEWRNSFNKMRSFVLSYYKDLFGNWPPKARSKKNQFSHSGLNRQCLKILYSDLCALYDLLVDRESITPRVIDQAFDDDTQKSVNPMIAALRQMLSEFDRSSPPILPPIPYDVPKLPTPLSIYENYNELTAKKQAKFDKSLQPNELQLLLIKSRNFDTDSLRMPFLDAFKEFELKEAKSIAPQDIADQRIGYWLFMYAVIQSLPMLVVDAPDLRHTEGVEYFLCEPPQGNMPWMVEDAGEVRKMWYQTAGQGIVQLSADVVMFSVEGIYMRSHCWLAAKEWEGQAQPGLALGGNGESVAGLGTGLGGVASPLEPPRAVFEDMDPGMRGGGRRGSASPGSAPGSRNASPARGRTTHAYRSSIALGLEPLPLGEEIPGGLPGAMNANGGSPRSSRVFSGGSVFSGYSGFSDPRPGSSGGTPTPQSQIGLRNNRSNGNLYAAAGGYGSVDNLALPQRPAHGRKLSHQGSLPREGSVASGSNASGVTGSTFDDILKSMDTGKKKKKGFFGS
ncbi:hypothetical protein V8F06_002418 [Rhypophila decipiens]